MCLAHWARICIVVLVAGTSGAIKQAKSLSVIEPFGAGIPSATRLSVLNKYESRVLWLTPAWRASVLSLEDFPRPSRGSEMATEGAQLIDAVDVSSLINDNRQTSKARIARPIIGLLAALVFLRNRLLRGSYCRECDDLRGQLSIASRNLARAREKWSTTANITINAADDEISSHRKQFRSYTEQVSILSSAIDDHQRTRHAKLAPCRQYEDPREQLLIASQNGSQNEIEILSAATGEHRRARHTKRSFCRVCEDLDEHRSDRIKKPGLGWRFVGRFRRYEKHRRSRTRSPRIPSGSSSQSACLSSPGPPIRLPTTEAGNADARNSTTIIVVWASRDSSPES